MLAVCEVDMKRIAIGLILVLTTSAASFAKDEAAASSVVAAHRKFFDAYRACNGGTIATLVADDMQFMHAGGMIEDKSSFVKSVSSCALSDISSEILNTRTYGDTGIVIGKLNYQTKAGPGGMLFFTEVFVKKNGAWTFVSHQSTPPGQSTRK
jgi:hypothetical protein